MRKGKNGLGKKENTAVAASARGFFFAFTLALCAVAAVVVGTANAATYTVCATGCDYATIQSAVNAATSGDTVFVYNGSYNENVNVGTAHLTLEGEGKDKVTVTAASSSDDVFEVTADWVNISGFTATGATSGDWIAGITLNGVQHCKISENNCSKNSLFGIYLEDSSNNKLKNNTANQNDWGIYVSNSGNNTLTGNTANLNDDHGIEIAGVGYNTLTGNTANENNKQGIRLWNTDGNNISCNRVQANKQAGFHLSGGSTGNTIAQNNILVNGNYNAATEGYEWNFYNDQSDAVTAKNNYWGTTNATKIDASIYDNDENAGKGEVDFSGYKSGPVPCAPVPELPTVVLFSAGLLGIAGYFLLGRRRREKK